MIREFVGCLIVLLSLSSIPRCQASRKDIFNFEDDQLTVNNTIRAVIDLTKKCLSDNGRTLVVTERLSDKLIRYLHRSATTSIVSIASSKLFVEEWYSASLESKEWYYGRHIYRFLWKSKIFLVSASSPAILKEQLETLKSTRWWNSYGIFVLIEDKDSIAQSCANAYDFLSLAWKYGLLSSIFVCQERDQTPSIYSYNPYGDSAPKPWLKNREIKNQQGHIWSLFKWSQYHGRSYTCADILYDKTTSLNGYPITASALSLSPFLYFNRNKTDFERYRGEDGTTMKIIWKFLNATIVDVEPQDHNAVEGWVDDNGTFHGNLVDINSGKVEIGFNSMILQPLWKVTATYPHSSVNLCFATKNRRRIPWLIALALVFDKWTTACVVVIFFLAAILFGYINQRRYFSGCLNALRVFVSSSFIRPLESNGFRMMLGFLLILPIVSNSVFQGKILSLIQNPSRYVNFEEFKDLKLAGFKMMGPELVKNFISSQEIRDKFVPMTDMASCLAKLYKNEPVACMNYCFRLGVLVSHQKNIHIAAERTQHYQSRYIAKPDWPLLDRFNLINNRIVESGLAWYYRTRSLYEKAAPLDYDSYDTKAEVFRLKDFMFLFIGLAIGWAIAILAFIAELIIFRLKTPKAFKRRITRRRVANILIE